MQMKKTVTFSTTESHLLIIHASLTMTKNCASVIAVLLQTRTQTRQDAVVRDHCILLPTLHWGKQDFVVQGNPPQSNSSVPSLQSYFLSHLRLRSMQSPLPHCHSTSVQGTGAGVVGTKGKTSQKGKLKAYYASKLLQVLAHQPNRS